MMSSDDLTIVWMNDAYLRATMRTRDDIIGKKLLEAFPSDPASESHQLMTRSFEKVIASGKPDEIALIRYDIHQPDGTTKQSFWSATHTPVTNASGQVELILQHTVDVTELHGLRRQRDEMGVLQRANKVQERNRDLDDESRRLKRLFEQTPGFVAIVSGPNHEFMLANHAYRELVGRQDLVGKTVAEALPEVVDQGFVALLDNVVRTGQPFVGNRKRTVLGDRPLAGTYYLDFIFQPIFSEKGEVTGVFIQGHDVSDRIAAEEQQRLMINELNHRVKNTLAIVQGLASQSFRQIAGSEQAQRTFDARLGALVAAHSLLTERNWESGELTETIRNVVIAAIGLDHQRVTISGPDISLEPQMAVSLAMIVHELCTNAINHGALSNAEGRVAISCQLTDGGNEQVLTVTWQEQGGPAVQLPDRYGFGTRLIQRGMTNQEMGQVIMEYQPEGIRCLIETRLNAVVS
ncbi:PAS domain-containing protein [Altererythrobacter xixiisoli]|uniref:histidine kinase n=1 Tax=Croceibacterium xixiisoli TaxID=1476466 RepID=A0A6I4TXH3_9SPHN|nr:PAS domain-containing protein [Croceibacterium xixiisoli]